MPTTTTTTAATQPNSNDWTGKMNDPLALSGAPDELSRQRFIPGTWHYRTTVQYEVIRALTEGLALLSRCGNQWPGSWEQTPHVYSALFNMIESDLTVLVGQVSVWHLPSLAAASPTVESLRDSFRHPRADYNHFTVTVPTLLEIQQRPRFPITTLGEPVNPFDFLQLSLPDVVEHHFYRACQSGDIVPIAGLDIRLIPCLIPEEGPSVEHTVRAWLLPRIDRDNGLVYLPRHYTEPFVLRGQRIESIITSLVDSGPEYLRKHDMEARIQQRAANSTNAIVGQPEHSQPIRQLQFFDPEETHLGRSFKGGRQADQLPQLFLFRSRRSLF
ncbi:hypothetical protein F4778DRAFT_785409 [Xylariomycetidae sp. FL2044]|nr:hypothetical protein F4778DRAFT_785409 [Xylariomycetidae sp. FL2044]